MSLRTYQYKIILNDDDNPIYGTGYITGTEQAINLRRESDKKQIFIPWHNVSQVVRLKQVDSRLDSEREKLRKAYALCENQNVKI